MLQMGRTEGYSEQSCRLRGRTFDEALKVGAVPHELSPLVLACGLLHLDNNVTLWLTHDAVAYSSTTVLAGRRCDLLVTTGDASISPSR